MNIDCITGKAYIQEHLKRWPLKIFLFHYRLNSNTIKYMLLLVILAQRFSFLIWYFYYLKLPRASSQQQQQPQLRVHYQTNPYIFRLQMCLPVEKALYCQVNTIYKVNAFTYTQWVWFDTQNANATCWTNKYKLTTIRWLISWTHTFIIYISLLQLYRLFILEPNVRIWIAKKCLIK